VHNLITNNLQSDRAHIPSRVEHVQSLMKIKVQVTVKVSAHKLVDLFLGARMSVLELVKEAVLDVETVWEDDIGATTEDVLCFERSYLRNRREPGRVRTRNSVFSKVKKLNILL